MLAILCIYITVIFGTVTGCRDPILPICKTCSNLTIVLGGGVQGVPFSYDHTDNSANCSVRTLICTGSQNQKVYISAQPFTFESLLQDGTGNVAATLICNENGQWVGNDGYVTTSIACQVDNGGNVNVGG